jgi:hypothetical protein
MTLHHPDDADFRKRDAVGLLFMLLVVAAVWAWDEMTGTNYDR